MPLSSALLAAVLLALPASAPGAGQRKPLPAFAGYTLDGQRFEVSSLLGRRSLLFFFNPEVDQARDAAPAVAAVAAEADTHNFDVVGIAVAAPPDTSRAFAREFDLGFPIVDDSTGRIANRLRLGTPLALLGVDAEGYVTFAVLGAAPESPDPTAVIEARLREALRMPATGATLDIGFGERPSAPDFSAERLEGGDRFELASLRGRPVVLIFFLHTCPHCHEALRFFEEQLSKIPEESRPELIGVSISNRSLSVKDRLRSEGLDFFPVLLDSDQQIRSAYGVMAGVPEIFLIDADGSIVAHTQGWRTERDPALMRMWLAKVSGQNVPMLLHSTGYSGSDACTVCHQSEHDTWALTSHAYAFDTLVRHGADSDPECVGCHVVGWEQPGGFALQAPAAHLEGVGCESCHGRGGPHLSPGFLKNGSYEQACLACHDAKHSLGFDYAEFVPRISHAANAELAALPLEEKRKLLAQRARPRQNLLPQAAHYVGSESCQSCHATEFKTWASSPHARSLTSLEKKGAVRNAECLGCHTTALGRPGGLPKGADPSKHPDLARVGCESCHGPGGDHVGEGATRIGTIVSLGDKCDSCVILQICGSCHDDANDPGFEFAVEKKIEAQRHGQGPQSGPRSEPQASEVPIEGPQSGPRSEPQASEVPIGQGPQSGPRSEPQGSEVRQDASRAGERTPLRREARTSEIHAGRTGR